MSFYSALDSRSLDLEVPTLFEILSANELANLLTPSLRYIVVHYTHKYPKYLLKIYSYFDELNLGARLILEYNFLKRWNSTFTEKFYGVKRSSDIGLKFKFNDQSGVNSEAIQGIVHQKKKLSTRQIVGSLFFLLGVPYIKEKLDVFYEKLYSDYLINKDAYSYKNEKWLKLLFIKLYPTINIASSFAQVFLQVLYISGRTVSPSIATYLLNIRYARLSAYDNMPSGSPSPPSEHNGTETAKSRIRPLSLGESINNSLFSRFLSPLRSSPLVSIFDTAFPVMMFSLKFLEWWQQSQMVRDLFDSTNNENFIKEALESAKAMPAPKTAFDFKNATVSRTQAHTTSKASDNEPKSEKSTTENSTEGNFKYAISEYYECALCKNSIHNPAMLETGYVFCYPCIIKHLSSITSQETNPRCPVTGRKLLGCSFNKEIGLWENEGTVRRLIV